MKLWILLHAENADLKDEESYRYLNSEALWVSYQSVVFYIYSEMDKMGGRPRFETEDEVTKVYFVDGNCEELWYYLLMKDVKDFFKG